MSISIKAVCFDLDGLMFNTEQIFYQSGLKLLNKWDCQEPEQVLSQMMGRRAEEAYTVLKKALELDETIDQLRAEAEAIFNDLLETSLEPMPGLFDLISHIESIDLPKGVATSSSKNYLHRMLDRYELTPRFHTLLGAEDVTHGKPNPEIYLKAASLMNVDPAEMLVLEDTGVGTSAAGSAGAHIVSVPHHLSETQDFSHAKHIANSLGDPYIYELLQ